MIFPQRLNLGLEDLLRDNQCGFRRNRSCIDQLYALRTIIHKTLDYNIPRCINFVNYRAAFYSMGRDFIWIAFDHNGLPQKNIRIMQAFFAATTSAVRFNGELSVMLRLALVRVTFRVPQSLMLVLTGARLWWNHLRCCLRAILCRGDAQKFNLQE